MLKQILKETAEVADSYWLSGRGPRKLGPRELLFSLIDLVELFDFRKLQHRGILRLKNPKDTRSQSRFDARYWMLGAGALGRPRGMEWGGRREEGSGWGTHVYLWRIHFDIWQN